MLSNLPAEQGQGPMQAAGNAAMNFLGAATGGSPGMNGDVLRLPEAVLYPPNPSASCFLRLAELPIVVQRMGPVQVHT